MPWRVPASVLCPSTSSMDATPGRARSHAPNGPHVRIECVRVLIRPGGKQRTRMCYRYPCCRAVAGYHMMVVVKGRRVVVASGVRG